MIDIFYIGAYWSSRAENVNEVTKKTVHTLTEMQKVDEQFLNWYEGDVSRKKALEKPLLITMTNIEKFYVGSVGHEELDERGFTNHIFSLGLWSGHKDDESSSVSFNVGGVFNTANLSNSCVISIPFEGQSRERLLKFDKLSLLFEILIRNWNPDSVVLVSKNLKKLLGTINEIGWVTYVKEIKDYPLIGNKIIFEKHEHGNLFYLNLENNEVFDYDLARELLPLKKILCS